MEILIIILILYLIYRKNYKKKYKKESKESAKVNEQDRLIYYRELPSSYSPAIVSILCNYQLEAYKDIPAVILNLCAKRYIDIKQLDDKCDFVVLEKNTDELMAHEKYILDWIINKTTFDREKWNLIVESDAISLNLIQNKNINEIKKKVYKSARKTILKPIIIIVLIIVAILGILYFGIYGLYHYVEKSANEINITSEEEIELKEEMIELRQSIEELFTAQNMNVLVIFGIIVIGLIIYIPYFVISVFINHKPIAEVQYKFKYIRTERGNEDYIKWIAFKKFLVDFSLIDTRDIQEVYIWEYYLAYATSLGIANQIIKSSDNRIFNNKRFNITNYSNLVENLDREINQF